jgi:polysaccharide pyruvyl transferase WcaK-like protein
MYRIYLEHGEAYGNLGEEAMLINAARRLRARISNVEFVIPRVSKSPLPSIDGGTFIPSPYPSMRGVMRKLMPSSRFRRKIHTLDYDPLALLTPYLMHWIGGIGKWRDMLDHLSKCHGVYFVGCANLNDFARLSFVLPKYALLYEAVARDIPVVVSSQTVGPLSISWVQRLVGKMVREATYFSTRDSGVTQNYLAQSGVDSSRIRFSGDEAFTLPVASEEHVNSYLKASGVSPSEPFALIHFRATDYTQQTDHYYETLAQAFDNASVDAKLCFLPMSYGDHSGDDAACGLAIRERMQNPERLTVLEPSTDAKVVRALFDRARWALGLSYHVQVFALSAACPFALLASGEYYETKAKGVHNLVDGILPLLSLSESDSSDLIQAIQGLESKQEPYRRRLRSIRDQILEVNDEPVKAMASALGEKA